MTPPAAENGAAGGSEGAGAADAGHGHGGQGDGVPQPIAGRRVETTAFTSGRFRAGRLVADRDGRPVTAVPIPGGTCYLTADGRVLAIDRDAPPTDAR